MPGRRCHSKLLQPVPMIENSPNADHPFLFLIRKQRQDDEPDTTKQSGDCPGRVKALVQSGEGDSGTKEQCPSYPKNSRQQVLLELLVQDKGSVDQHETRQAERE